MRLTARGGCLTLPYLGLGASGAKGDEGGVKPLSRGRFEVRLAQTGQEVAAAQHLRHLAFWESRGRACADGRDADAFDASARHMLVRDGTTGDLVACCRVSVFDGATVSESYSAQFYDLSRLSCFPGPMLELGRFCLHPDRHDPDILRLAWAALACLVDEAGVGLLFGCSSFPGADPARHAVALATLAARTAPAIWRPEPLAPHRVALCDVAARDPASPERPQRPETMAHMPALLRTYLSMGGWVSDHAVIDRQMDTLHVLTGVEIASIPLARARALRAIATEGMG